jgi:hypothetical protein
MLPEKIVNAGRVPLCALLLLLTCLTASAQDEEPLGTDINRRLPVIGRTQAKEVQFYPLSNGVRRRSVDVSGATSFRMHFKQNPLPGVPPAAPWRLQIRNPADEQDVLWTFCSGGTDDDVWSPEVIGQKAVVFVTAGVDCEGTRVATEERSEPRISVDKVTPLKPVTQEQVPVADQLKPIKEASPSIRQAGRSVAKLLIRRDSGEGEVPCTGFLVGKDLLMTNRHCIRSGTEAKHTSVQFDYDVQGAQPRVTAEVKELVLTSCDLDFVLLRLNKSYACQTPTCSGPTERKPLALSRTEVTQNQSLVAIQHPDGQAKQFSKIGCMPDQLQMVGLSSTRTDFSHKCDTLNGSSGTPLQLLGDGDVIGPVVGLHHLGPRADSTQEAAIKQVNRAVSAWFIIEYITKMNPRLLEELSVQ